MFHPHDLNLTDAQRSKLAKARKNKVGTSVKLSYGQLHNGPDRVMLTQQQLGRIRKSISRRTGMVLKVSAKQLRQKGGFLPFLLPAIGALGALAGGAAGITKAVNSAKANRAMLEEARRHNRAMEGKG